MAKVKIKYTVLIELLKSAMADTIIDEALTIGEIDVVDDILGEKIGEISLKRKERK